MIIPCFQLSHNHPLSGHMGINKTFATLKRFFYWPGMYKWVSALIADCLDCQVDKSKRSDLHNAPLEQWGELETQPFQTLHIDHKGPISPPSNRNTHCLMVIDAFSRMLGAYPVPDTSANHTINAVMKWILSYGLPRIIIHDQGTAFINKEFAEWTKEMGITMASRTAYAPWTNGKVEVQNQHLSRYWRTFLNESGNNWALLAPKFAFSHNTSVSYTTGMTPYEVAFGVKPQIPLTLKLGLLRDKNKRCTSEFCKDLPPHAHSEDGLSNPKLNKLLRPQLSQELLRRESDFKQIYSSTYQRARQQTAKAHEYRNKFKLGKPLAIGQKVLFENHKIDLTKSQKLKHLRLGPFTVVEQITATTYKIQEDSNPKHIRNVHRNHLIEYYPKSVTLPPLVENYAIPSDNTDTFYANLATDRIRDLNSHPRPDSTGFFPMPITPLELSAQTSINPQVAFPRQPIELPKTPGSNHNAYDSGIISPNSTNASISPVNPFSQRPLPFTPFQRTLGSAPTTSSPIIPDTLGPSTSTLSKVPVKESKDQRRNRLTEALFKTSKPKKDKPPPELKYQRSQPLPGYENPSSILRKKERKGYNE